MASWRREARSADPTDYYDILGVSKSSSASDIKRAYLRLARRWHPDKNDASRKSECEKKFKAITEAYDTLRDGAKRAHYDRYGAEGDRGPQGFSFAEADAMFRTFFSTAHPSRRRADHGADGRGRRAAGMGGDPFAAMGGDPFESMFGSMFGGEPEDDMPSGYAEPGRRGGDPFPDMFRAMESMMGEMHGAMASSSSSFFSSSSGGLGGPDGVVGRSTRSETVIRDGRRVTRTVSTVRYADGREETTTDESTGDAAGRLEAGAAADPSRRLMR